MATFLDLCRMGSQVLDARKIAMHDMQGRGAQTMQPAGGTPARSRAALHHFIGCGFVYVSLQYHGSVHQMIPMQFVEIHGAGEDAHPRGARELPESYIESLRSWA